jgi:N-acetylglucosaminyldiphosphoundecaprenol N-acetyl-beta-D-mannosaminyltransferase
VAPGELTALAMIDKGKFSVLGVMVDAVDYRSATDKVIAAAHDQRPLALTALAVHGVMTGVEDVAHNARLNSFDLVTPDGQPVRWGLEVLHGVALADRVYGPTLTMHVLERCAAEGLPVYLYGSTTETLAKLVAELQRAFPALKIAGTEASKFRNATDGEDRDIAERVRASGARVLFVGLGCPRQEIFTYAMRPLLDMPILAVGAAFDYHAGLLRKPPAWMQRYALEWLWRLGLEPARLWRRYLILNPAYLARLFAQKTGVWRVVPAPPAVDPPRTFPV